MLPCLIPPMSFKGTQGFKEGGWVALLVALRVKRLCRPHVEYERCLPYIWKSFNNFTRPKIFFENPIWTHKCEMVTGTKGKHFCVWLVFLAQLAKTSKLDRWAVGWWENLWENSTFRKAWPPLLSWKQFHNCCFRTYWDLGILFPHSLKIINKAEVPRHQRVFYYSFILCLKE